MHAWLQAFRLRTLPLSLASIILGSLLAAAAGAFSWQVAILAALTTIFLQILSNLANDYGDYASGLDGADRQGPARMVQSGQITAGAMRTAMWIFSILSLFSGLGLLALALRSWADFMVFLGLGILAIIAAITYTVGKRPYGYIGLGDISVLIFFGFVGVLGTFYLHTHTLVAALWMPAASCGLLAVGVLNVNNIRDIESDRAAGKRSVPVRLGRARAVAYHGVLLVLAVGFALAYNLLNNYSWGQYIFLFTIPLFWTNWQAVRRYTQAAALDPYLKQLALSTLLFVVLFGIGQMWR